MDQEPRRVAAFVSECLDYRRFEAPDLHPYVTSETLQELGRLIHFRLIMMTLLMSLVLS